MSDDIRREAERLLAQLRADHGPPSLGYLFPDTPGMPVPLEDWIAATDPESDQGPSTAGDGHVPVLDATDGRGLGGSGP